MSSLTPIDASLIPSQVRAEGTKAENLYQSALGFEQMLVQQLAQGLTDSTQSADDTSSDDSGDDASDTSDDGSGSSALGVYQGMLPDALAQSVTGSGGMGLAMGLYQSMGGQTASPDQTTAGATASADVKA
jgi:Rod binding domain-containing protein